MFRLAAAFSLAALPAAAHTAPHLHIHGTDAAAWLVLGSLIAGGIYLARVRAEAKKRGRK